MRLLAAPAIASFVAGLQPPPPAKQPSPGCHSIAPLPTGRVNRQLYDFPYRLSNPKDHPNITQPKPLLLLFHGWSGGLDDLNRFHDHGLKHGYVIAAPLGQDSKHPERPTSWNGAGTTKSPGPRGAICTYPEKDPDLCYEDCDGNCADGCWWTTCKDSVAETIEVLEDALANACVDMNQIWAAGFSNGGVFVHELAKDPRIAFRLRGIIPLAGSPHIGFNEPPLARMSYLGMWGDQDICVPAANEDTREYPGSDTVIDPGCGGWKYTWHQNVTALWAQHLGCQGKPRLHNYTATSKALHCKGWSSCGEDHISVVGCIWRGGHHTSDFMPMMVWCQMRGLPECEFWEPAEPFTELEWAWCGMAAFLLTAAWTAGKVQKRHVKKAASGSCCEAPLLKVSAP